MAAGLAVVTTAQGVSGLAVEAGVEYDGGGDPEALALAVLRQLASPLAAAQMGAAGRAYVNAEHDWMAVAEQLQRVYATCLAGRAEGDVACV